MIPYQNSKTLNMTPTGGSISDIMQGATPTQDGKAGAVPQLKAGQDSLFLRGDGKWAAAQGEKGTGITNITQNPDYTLTINMSDGTHYDTDPVKGEKGESGASGVNILQYTMRLTGWVNGEYSFETQFPFIRYNLEIEPDGDLITDQQLDAWNKGQMVGSFSANKCIAKGDTPTTDIPIILKAQSKGA